MNFNIVDIPLAYQQSMTEKKIWTEHCPFTFDRLRLINIIHYNFAGELISGELVAFDVVAESVLTIFKQLFDKKFPLSTVRLMDEFFGDDSASMASNNSSCFNFRNINNSPKLSLHAIGMAIDINPVQNPYLVIDRSTATIEIQPAAGMEYLNRYKKHKAMTENIVDIFKSNGFKVWGGDWSDPIDYQHFQVECNIAEQLIRFNYFDGTKLFNNHIQAT